MSEIAEGLYSAAQVRDLDRRAIEVHGIAGYTLMQRAAQASWEALVACWPAARSLTVLCGSGNNGGDGYELARLARRAGWTTRLFAVDGVPTQADAALAHAAWCGDGGAVERFDGMLPDSEIIADAIFGTGLSRAPQALAAAAVNAVNAARDRGARVVALDVPSGLDAGCGVAFSPAVSADLTISFIGRKLGIYTGEGPALAGDRRFARLAVPDDVYAAAAPLAQLQRAADLAGLLPLRRRDAHKGRHGHVLVVGGNHGMMGAALLAARAALRCGAGLVSVATRDVHAVAMTAGQPELMCHGVDELAVRALIARADVVAIGPGLGQDRWARGLWSAAIDSGKPLIVDADALNLLAAEPAVLPAAVLTPHPGEAARLLGVTTAEIQRDRLAALRELESRYHAAIVLKGAGSLCSGHPPRVCPFGNPGMAVGGSGDVLTGVIAALRAQGLARDEAAQAGVLVHALAGDRAAGGGERGLLPSDLLACLRDVVNPVRA